MALIVHVKADIILQGNIVQRFVEMEECLHFPAMMETILMEMAAHPTALWKITINATMAHHKAHRSANT